jgi:TonB family protein
MSEFNSRPTIGSSQGRGLSVRPQTGRLFLALVLLVVALVGVVLKDWQFWFGPEQSISDAAGPAAAPAAASKPGKNPAPAVASQTHSAPAIRAQKYVPAAKAAVEPKPTEVPAVAVTRTVLPAMDVEVIAGDQHSKIHPGTNAAKVEPTQPSATLTTVTKAAEHEALTAEAVRPSPTYPLLAQHMNVQGSVVLQAVIGADGVIQNLHVVSGPVILSAAAQQAVREWHFKPVLQNGQAVETKAKITVNFTIKIADGANDTVAEARADEIQILSR